MMSVDGQLELRHAHAWSLSLDWCFHRPRGVSLLGRYLASPPEPVKDLKWERDCIWEAISMGASGLDPILSSTKSFSSFPA